jgi:DNA repair photolyase
MGQRWVGAGSVVSVESVAPALRIAFGRALPYLWRVTNRDHPIRGRGAWLNPSNRFDRLIYEPAAEEGPDGDEELRPSTEFFRDNAQSIINFNDSPDVNFDAGINPYRGCEHGCAYCYARPTHEYLGFSAGLDFETKIVVKEHAPVLLREALLSPRWKPQVLGLSGNTDPYQPVERKLKLTRGCLEVLAAFRNPVGVITKNHLVTRDIDLLSELARHQAATVMVSITTLDAELARRMEPRTSAPHRRLDAIRRLSKAGIPVGLLMAPVIPGLNDHEIPAVVQAAADAGIQRAGHILVRLPHGVSDLFESWVRTHYPLRADKVLHRIRETREGRLNDSNFGTRMKGKGIYADQIHQMFRIACLRSGLDHRFMPALSTAAFRRVDERQPELF